MIPINRPMLGEEEASAVLRVLRSGRLTEQSPSGGHMVRRLESRFSKVLGADRSVAVNSGTSALMATLMGLGISKGDRVLVPSFTFVATVNAVVMSGGLPVFVDVNRRDFTMDTDHLGRLLARGGRFVMPVHLYGNPADMNQILELSDKFRADVVEDACQSLGSLYGERMTGTLGRAGCFSLWASKIITTGEGGMICTGDERLANRISAIRTHGLNEQRGTAELGLNLRMPEVEAAIGLVQLSKLKSFLHRRRKNARILTEMLRHVKGIGLPQVDEAKRPNWYLYTITVEGSRDLVLSRIRKQNVDARVFYGTPVHKMPYYERLGYGNLDLPNTLWTSGHVISLPVHPGLSEEDLETIGSAVRKAAGEVI